MKVVVLGAGVIGLCTAALLADDGHDVIVVDRDAQVPPDPADAWLDWQRPGVNQFRLAHFLLSRFRIVAQAELPRLVDELRAAGACQYNIVANVPDEMKGGSHPDDDQYDLVTARRPVVEAVAARVAENTSGVSIRRGNAAAALIAGTPARTGVPNVVGVALDNDDRLDADLVVDATGRRSPLPRWLDALGAKPMHEEIDDSGFVYYGRHFASADGTLPVMFGPLKQDYGSLGLLALPADNGTWSVTLTASSEDAAMRRLTDPEKWAAVVRLLPLHAHWIDASPIDTKVSVMAKLEDRLRDLAPGGEPVATGVVAVADAWSCTNPSLGRGISVGLIHAVALRNFLRQDGSDDPWATAAGWAAVTRQDLEPLFRTTRRYDTHRLQETKAIIEGRPYTADDPTWRLQKALEATALLQSANLRAMIDIAMFLRTPEQMLENEAFCEQALAEAAPLLNEPPLGPSRDQLLAAVA